MQSKNENTIELMPISLIYIDNFPKNLKFSNENFKIMEVNDDKSAFEKLEENINNNKLYNVILSGHNTVEKAYGLLKSFLDYNIEKQYCFDNSNYPFFLFLEDEQLNKKKLYAHYIEEEKKREDLDIAYIIESKIILFINLEFNLKDSLVKVVNYYHRKDIEIKTNDYYSPLITFMFIGLTGTGKSTMINELNGEKLAYSSSENQMKTRFKGEKKKLVYKNGKYPILNQDTEGFEIADNSQIEQIYKNIDKNIGIHLKDRVHVVIYLFKNDRGLDNNDVPLLIQLHKMKILYYFIHPRKEGHSMQLIGKANRLILSLIKKIKDNDEGIKNLFQNHDMNEAKKLLEEINGTLKERIFSADILTPNSKGLIALLEQIKKDLLKIYNIHQQYLNKIEEFERNPETVKVGISGNISSQNQNDYIKILDDSPFFYKHSIDDIKRKEAERLLDNCEVSSLWLFFYNNRVESFRRDILKKIQNIYSEVKINTEIDIKNYSSEESMFYKTKNTKEYIQSLIDFFAIKYKEIELNKKYYSICKQYNDSIKKFEQYVEKFKTCKLNGEPVRYDIDFV